MTRYIIRKYLSENIPDGREIAGIILGAVGIAFDLLLFVSKYFAGLLSGSVAITADAFNNLTDAGAHITVLLGFALANRRPSRRFPFGYGRLEYITGLFIAAAILFVGGRMAVSSVETILRPKAVDSSPTVMAILALSIAVKGYMYHYNKRISALINSAPLKAVALDSICDCFATGAIILSVLIRRSAGVPIDSWAGLVSAACILYAGAASAKDSIAPLLGLAVDENTVKTLDEITRRIPGVRSVGDIAVHDYGPKRRLLTMQICGSVSDRDMAQLHREIGMRLDADAVIEIKEIGASEYNAAGIRQE